MYGVVRSMLTLAPGQFYIYDTVTVELNKGGSMIAVRAATIADAEAVIEIMELCWSEQRPNHSVVGCVLTKPGRSILLAILAEQVIGFVDGFLTLSSSGMLRWEVDLLAVHPAFRGYGAGQALVETMSQIGHEKRAGAARALIQVANTASERVFGRCGYRAEETILELWSANPQPDADRTGIPASDLSVLDGYFIPVTTLNYRGLWLEDARSSAEFSAGRVIAGQHGLDLVGCLLPCDRPALIDIARQAGYAFINRFRWWWLPLSPG